MPRSETNAVSAPTERRPIDWRGWIIVAWMLWFGLLYAKMVIERRSQKFHEIVSGSTNK